MTRITVECWKHIKSGETVPSGFNYYLTAPAEPGLYTLYELVGDNNTHEGWQWEKD